MAAASALGTAVIGRRHSRVAVAGWRPSVAAVLGVAWLGLGSQAGAATHYLIVSGLGGQAEYTNAFARHVSALEEAAQKSVADIANITVLRGDGATRAALEEAFGRLAGTLEPQDSLIVFLVGHGSYDGEQYKYNLPGQDPTGADLAAMLAGIRAGSQLVVNTTSASGAVFEDWAADGRIVVTATRSGAERNATRFAGFWAEALGADAADLDKNGGVSAEEAFDYASRRVADSFEAEDALATEHPQMAGGNAARFSAARLVARATATAEQRELSARMESLEAQIAELRERREQLPADEYLNQLQGLLVELATVQRQLDDDGSP